MRESEQANKQAGKQTSRQASKPASRNYTHRNLDVWQMAQEVAARIIVIMRRLPRDPESIEIRRQIVRSAGSIGANIAEGHGRYSMAAYRNHLSIARGSATETDSWLDLLRRLEYISEPQEQQLARELGSVIAIITTKMRGLSSQIEQRQTRIGEDGESYDPVHSGEEYGDPRA